MFRLLLCLPLRLHLLPRPSSPSLSRPPRSSSGSWAAQLLHPLPSPPPPPPPSSSSSLHRRRCPWSPPFLLLLSTVAAYAGRSFTQKSELRSGLAFSLLRTQYSHQSQFAIHKQASIKGGRRRARARAGGGMGMGWATGDWWWGSCLSSLLHISQVQKRVI